MSNGAQPLTGQRLTTPRAAAVAGILCALLLGTAYVLIRVSIPADPADTGAWLAEQTAMATAALALMPFAGIAFLWFIGVVRDRIGDFEDRFFSVGDVGLSWLGTGHQRLHPGLESAQPGGGPRGWSDGHDRVGRGTSPVSCGRVASFDRLSTTGPSDAGRKEGMWATSI
jgi:hypothetical protein